MTGIEKEFITYAIVTRGTKASFENMDMQDLGAQGPEAIQAETANPSRWTGFKSYLVGFWNRLSRKNPWGLKGPHFNPLLHRRFTPPASG